MISTDEVSVYIYEINGKLKVVAEFNINGLSLDRNQHGFVDLRKREILEKALETALSNWQMNV